MKKPIIEKKSSLLHKESAPEPGLRKKFVKLKINLVLIKKINKNQKTAILLNHQLCYFCKYSFVKLTLYDLLPVLT